jgi:hypothetical protein
LIIHYDGGDYPFDLDDVTVKQAIKIEKYMGCPFAEWGKRLQAGEDMAARQTLGWFILTGGDLATGIEDVDFQLIKLAKALDEAFTAEAEKEAARPVPTVAAAASNGQTPAADSSPLSLPPSSGEISR